MKDRSDLPPEKNNLKNAGGKISSGITRFTFFLVRLVIVTIFVFALLGTISYLTIFYFISGTEVKAPSIIGKSAEQAIEILANNNLSLCFERKEYNEIVKKDVILSQYPSAGMKVKASAKIKVVLSNGPEMASVPDVRENDRRKAGITLRRADLKVGIVTRLFDEDFEKESVITQDPPPETKVPRGYKVSLLVSLGKEILPVSMPNLISQTLPETQSLVASMNLSIKTIAQRSDKNIVAGRVAGQEPVSGVTVTPETPIKIILSTGAK